MERKQFTFYASFSSALARIKSKSARCDAYDAICNYALYGTEPDCDALPDAAAIAFELVRPTLDAGAVKAANRLNKREQTDNKSITNENKPITNQ